MLPTLILIKSFSAETHRQFIVTPKQGIHESGRQITLAVTNSIANPINCKNFAYELDSNYKAYKWNLMRWRETVWQWVTKSAEIYMEGLPRKAFINSLTNCLKEYPQLNGREVVVVERIEELCRSGIERHAALAVDNRASTHLQIACLVQGTYQTLLPWFKNDHEKVIEIIRKPVGESSAAAVGVAQRIALLLSFDKFRLVSQGLKHMEADFGKAFLVEHYEKPNFHRARVRRCLYHSVFAAEGNPELTPIFCALDSMWFNQLKPQKHGVEFQRPTTLAKGNDVCDFLLRRIPTN